MSARDRILGRLAAAAPSTSLPAPRLNAAEAEKLTGATLDERLPTFRAALTGFHAEIFDARSGTGWAALINELCATRGIRRLLLPSGLNGFAAAGDLQAEIFERPIETFKDALFKDIDA